MNLSPSGNLFANNHSSRTELPSPNYPLLTKITPHGLLTPNYSLLTDITPHGLLSPHYSLLTILPATCRCATHHYKKRACPTYVSTPLSIEKRLHRWCDETPSEIRFERFPVFVIRPYTVQCAYRHAIEQFCFPGFRVKWWESQSNRCSLYFLLFYEANIQTSFYTNKIKCRF